MMPVFASWSSFVGTHLNGPLNWGVLLKRELLKFVSIYKSDGPADPGAAREFPKANPHDLPSLTRVRGAVVRMLGGALLDR